MQFQPDHIHIRCADPQKAQTFFVDILGAINPSSFENVNGIVYTVECHGYNLFFAPALSHLNLPADADAPHWGVYQLAWRVPDLLQAVKEIKAKGGVITKDVFSPRPGMQAAFAAGPDGVEIELMQY